MQVWTYASRVAFVLSVTSKGAPIQNGIKLQRLQQLLLCMMSAGDGRGTVEIRKVCSLFMCISSLPLLA